MSTQLKNVAFGDNVLKEDSNGSVGNIKTGNIQAGGIVTTGITAQGDVDVGGSLTVNDAFYFFYNGTKYRLVVNQDYGTLTAEPVEE